MTGRLETSYGTLLKYIRVVANPFKKVIIVTECKIHKFINTQALEILKNDNFTDAYNFFSDYLSYLNAGVTWADQDLKSMGHFYNPFKGRGLYGNKSAMTLGVEYYENALKSWMEGDFEVAMFYLGAAIHLVQDMTVPQHANIRLMDSHKQFETFIKRTYLQSPAFTVHKGGYYYMRCINDAITCNARTAINIFTRLKKIEDEYKRFYTITKFILPLAQKSSAGCLLMFYKDTARQYVRCGPNKQFFSRRYME